MKSKLLDLLRNSNDYISGEELSKIFNVSRSAIWKHMKSLKEDGYEIEGISKKGYKLISSPDIIEENTIISNTKTKIIGKNIKYYKQVKSTNETAKLLAESSLDGTLVLSEIQSGGKGRLGRIWASPKGGIWMTLILKPDIDPIYANKITQIAAAALINVFNSYNIETKIKWPNDIYLNGKKLCGILTEMKCDMDRIHYIILGIGINVNLNPSDFNSEIKNKATSLKLEFNKTFNRSLLVANFLTEFEKLYLPFVSENNFKEVVKICKENSIILDKDAFWIRGNEKIKVHCIGLNDDGALIVKDENNKLHDVISGEITFH